MPVNFQKLEKKWQERWEKAKIFQVKEGKKKKLYILEMLPYPSAAGLHMGHIRNYAIGDAFARFKRMQGFNVLYPMGYDAFGLPAENAAIKSRIHPKKYTERAISGIRRNQKALGLSYDWTREIATCYPEYYRWNQWIFLKMLERGLAYKKRAPVNWCPSCETVLANEQVENGRCWRCDSEVAEKQVEQWFFGITKYADELLRGLKKLEGWPEKIRTMQENWIGKSHGVDIHFKLAGTGKTLPTFTTRCDTVFSVTFLAIAPEHPLAEELVKGTRHEKGAKAFMRKAKKESMIDRVNEEKEKEGVFTGRYAINPANNERVPIWIANFAVMYGSGIVMCDAHDKRDFRFARKYGIPLKFVISPDGKPMDPGDFDGAFTDDGILFNSGKFSGMRNTEALPGMAAWLEKTGKGRKAVNYKLRDWGISRQRYWGTPIPVVYCEKCGMVPVPEKDLPVILPTDVKFTGHGNPLKSSKKFLKTACPKCRGPAERETDTMDTFVDSSWYFLRYLSPGHDKPPGFDARLANQWMPVDQYIGGAEHAVMHLLYARFFYKVLRDLGYVKGDEPFTRLFNQGIVYKGGHKMSKSFGNVVTQGEIAGKYGIDTVRLFLLFVASPDKQMEWSDKGVIGAHKFLNRVFKMVREAKGGKAKPRTGKKTISDRLVLSVTHSTLREVTEDIEGFRLNAAVNRLMGLANGLQRYLADPRRDVLAPALKTLAVMLSPFTPHMAEEMWEMLGGKGLVSAQRWPEPDRKLIDPRLEGLRTYVSDVTEDVREVAKILNKKPGHIHIYVSPLWKYTVYDKILERADRTRDLIPQLMKDPEVRRRGKKAVQLIRSLQKRVLSGVPSQGEELEILLNSKDLVEKEFKAKVHVWREEDTKKHDPEKRAHRAEPLKPAIYIE